MISRDSCALFGTHGVLLVNPSNSWELLETLLDIIGTHGVSWGLLRTPGFLGDFLGLLRSPWVSRGSLGLFGILYDTLGSPLGLLRET